MTSKEEAKEIAQKIYQQKVRNRNWIILGILESQLKIEEMRSKALPGNGGATVYHIKQSVYKVIDEIKRQIQELKK